VTKKENYTELSILVMQTLTVLSSFHVLISCFVPFFVYAYTLVLFS